MISELGLIDPWRSRNPSGKDLSFFSNVHNSYSRSDLFCLSQQHMHKVTDCHIEPTTLSDHAPVTLVTDLNKENFFRYWRLNVSLLTNTMATQVLKQHLKEYFEINDNGEVTPSMLWGGAKAVIRGKMIQIASRLKKIRLEEQMKLENRKKQLELEHKTTRAHTTSLELKENRKTLKQTSHIQSRRSLKIL